MKGGQKSVFINGYTRELIDKAREDNEMFSRMSFSAVLRELVIAGYKALIENEPQE